MSEKHPKQVYVIYIRCTAEALWKAITDGKITPDYYLELTVTSDFRPESTIEYRNNLKEMRVAGRILEVEEKKKLVHTFGPTHETAQSVVTWLIEPKGDTIKLTLTHENISDEQLFHMTVHGWQIIVNSLKTLLETGKALGLRYDD